MASTAQPSASFSAEKTFSSFDRSQGANYAENRRKYHPNLYQLILDHHTSTGGELNTVIDLGCGPGTAAGSLAPHFTHTIGLDPSEGMISTARSLVDPSHHIRFEVSTAESIGGELDPPIQDGSIDLITAATCAHWFDMSRFWPRAAQVLKPGGTVAIWTSSAMRVDPSMPNDVAIQKLIERFEEQIGPYITEGNRITRGLYRDLLLPWTLDTPVPEFDEGNFLRKEYGGDEDGDAEFYADQKPVPLDKVEKMMGTGSPVVRWREANPDAVGTEKDIVRMFRRDVERLLHEAGVEKGQEMINGRVRAALLMVKKKA